MIPLLSFTKPPGILDPALPCSKFAKTPLAKEAAVKLEGPRTHFMLDRCVIANKTFQATIIYEVERLTRLELFLVLPGDVKGWAGWTQEGEQKRKMEGEAWLHNVFAEVPTVEPLEMDGIKVEPFQPTWDHARVIKGKWGKVSSYFDSKAGFAGILLQYGAERE